MTMGVPRTFAPSRRYMAPLDTDTPRVTARFPCHHPQKLALIEMTTWNLREDKSRFASAIPLASPQMLKTILVGTEVGITELAKHWKEFLVRARATNTAFRTQTPSGIALRKPQPTAAPDT
jgi:hypothetical protein